MLDINDSEKRGLMCGTLVSPTFTGELLFLLNGSIGVGPFTEKIAQMTISPNGLELTVLQQHIAVPD